MMQRTNDPEVIQLVRRALPSYRGRKIYIDKFYGGMRTNSYWDEGHRDYWTYFNVRTGQSTMLEQNGTVFDGKNYHAPEQLPPNVVLIQHTFSGTNQYVVVHS